MSPLAEDVATQFLAVGRVNQAGFNTRGSCSGTLIRPDVVLTAGHCSGRLSAGNKSKMFVAGWRRGEYVAARNVVRQERHPAYFGAARHDPRFDVGLLFLAEPITEVLPIPIARASDEIVAIVGYHRYIPHLLSGRLDCPVRERSVKVHLIGCPVVSGNSGGPVLEMSDDHHWQVTGVVSSSTGDGALVTLLPDWVYDMLEEHLASR